MGAATAPPTPPPTTRTANARSPWYPMNQASVCGGLALPNSAVPVLPTVPAGRPAPAAVPIGLETTACIMVRRPATTPASRGCAVAVASPAPVTRRGRCKLPESTEAATSAMASGDAVTWAWPMAVAAASEGEVGVGTLPPNADRPIFTVAPMPNCDAVVAKLAAGSELDSPMNAVLHDMANAWSSESEDVVSPSKLWNTSPLTVMLGGQVAGLEGVEPCSSRSAAVTTLNVEPGGYAPTNALLVC